MGLLATWAALARAGGRNRPLVAVLVVLTLTLGRTVQRFDHAGDQIAIDTLPVLAVVNLRRIHTSDDQHPAAFDQGGAKSFCLRPEDGHTHPPRVVNPLPVLLFAAIRNRHIEPAVCSAIAVVARLGITTQVPA